MFCTSGGGGLTCPVAQRSGGGGAKDVASISVGDGVFDCFPVSSRSPHGNVVQKQFPVACRSPHGKVVPSDVNRAVTAISRGPS